jgi:UDP-N-acetylglucosamine--N-acetylmuramyl-(pentapeptide) pyrophosphoryl-undecaprenol N-acetylglucosamine transferase
MGGYVAAPVMLAARLLKIPVVLMEPNAIPGLTNRRLAKTVQRALVSFQETTEYFPQRRAEVSGMPVRKEFFSLTAREPSPDRPFTILITGGSRGSRTLNNASKASWPLFRDSGLNVNIIHQSGTDDYAALAEIFISTGLSGRVVPFLSDMPDAFGEADLIVCRSGASTVSELAAAGKPSVLVPFPYAADDHQLRNAEALRNAGASRLVPDKEMTGQRLFDEVTELMRKPQQLVWMAANARMLARPHAAQRAADVLEEVAVR